MNPIHLYIMSMSGSGTVSGVDRYVDELAQGMSMKPDMRVVLLKFRRDKKHIFIRQEEKNGYVRITVPLPVNLSEIISQPYWMGKYCKHVFELLFEKNVFYHPTMMFRTSFFKKHGLKYEEYPYAEDYKLWFEAAKCKAKFYVEPQPLYYYRNNDTQVSVVRKHDQAKTKARIQEEILCHLLSRSSYRDLFYKNYQNQKELVQKGLLSYTTMFSFFRILFNESEPEVYF